MFQLLWLILLSTQILGGIDATAASQTDLDPAKATKPMTAAKADGKDENAESKTYVLPIQLPDLVLMAREASHRAIDFPAPTGTPVHVIANGTVSYAGWYPKYGKVLFINHDSGIQSRYAHLDRFLVKKGTVVKQNDIVGEVGLTGRTTGPHLHFEILTGMFEDKTSFTETAQKMDPFEIMDFLGSGDYRWIGNLADWMIRGKIPDSKQPENAETESTPEAQASSSMNATETVTPSSIEEDWSLDTSGKSGFSKYYP